MHLAHTRVRQRRERKELFQGERLVISLLFLKVKEWKYSLRKLIILRAGSHGIPSPNMEAKSQLLSLKKSSKYG